MEYINDLLISMKPLLEEYGYFALVASIALEGIGIPMPGQSLMIAASILASQHIMSFSMVVIVCWLSAFIGNTCGYLIGYYFEEWLDKKGYISGPKMQKLQLTVQKYGATCLVISRFVEGMKQFMPLSCGIAKMPRRTFFIGNTIATTIWVAAFCVLTHFAFEHLHQLSAFYARFNNVIWCVAAILFIALITYILKRRKNKKVNNVAE